MKTCTNCNITKPFSEFTKAQSNRDGLQKHCRSCRAEEKRAKRKELGSREAIDLPASKYCPSCETDKPASAFSHDLGAVSGLGGWCKDCTNAARRQQRASDPVFYRMKTMLSHAKARAFEEGVAFDLTLDWLMEMFGHITHCPVLGIKIDWSKRGVGPSHHSPTIDKLIGAHGYTKGNVVLISHKANAMKSDATPEELLLFCAHHLRRLAERSTECNDADVLLPPAF